MARKMATRSKRSKKPGVTVALTDNELRALKEAGRIPRRLLEDLIRKSAPGWFSGLSDREARDLLKKKPLLKPSQAGRSILQAFAVQYGSALNGQFGSMWLTQLPRDLSSGFRPPEIPEIGPVRVGDRQPDDPPDMVTMTLDTFWQIEAHNLLQTACFPAENPKYPDKRPHSLRIPMPRSDVARLKELADRMRLEVSVLARLAIVRFLSGLQWFQESMQKNKQPPHA